MKIVWWTLFYVSLFVVAAVMFAIEFYCGLVWWIKP